MVSAQGRGRFYSRRRALVERTLDVIYGDGWPARAWGKTRFAERVARLGLDFELLAPGERPSLRIGFASDLHFGKTTSHKTLDRAAALLCREPLDVLLLGGDYVFLHATDRIAADLERWARSIPAPTKLAVMGNHDLWTDHGKLERGLERAGVRTLLNESVRLPAPYADVAIVAIDDPWTGSPDAKRAFAGSESASLRIGLGHAPEGLTLLHAEGTLDLYACGHTHGGHVALPSRRPIVVPGIEGRKRPHGLHRVRETLSFTSRGVGGIEIPLRAHAEPDVAVFTLRARR